MIAPSRDDIIAIETAYSRFNSARSLRLADGAHRIIDLGRARLLLDPARPADSDYNRVIGLPPDGVEPISRAVIELDAIGAAGRFELDPEAVSPANSDALIAAGFRPTASIVWLAADVAAPPALEPGVAVRRWGPERADDFLDLLERESSPISPEVRARRRAYYCTDTFRCFVAFAGEAVAGLATSWVHGDAALFGNAQTFSGYRRRGVQTALFRARMADAAELGLSWVTTDTAPATSSQRNAQRAGFAIHTVRTVWSRVTV